METDKSFKKMVDFQKVFFDNAFGMMKTFQNQGQVLMNQCMANNPFFHDSGKKAYSFWTESCDKGMNDYKAFMDKNMDQASKMFGQSTPPSPPAQPEKQSPQPEKKS